MKYGILKDTETTSWIGKQIPILIMISSNLIQKPSFLCNPNPHELVSSFVHALEILATQSRAQKGKNLLHIATFEKSTFDCFQEVLTQRHSHCVGIEAEDVKSKNSSTPFLQIQKNQFIVLQEPFESYSKILSVLGFKSVDFLRN